MANWGVRRAWVMRWLGKVTVVGRQALDLPFRFLGEWEQLLFNYLPPLCTLPQPGRGHNLRMEKVGTLNTPPNFVKNSMH